MIRGSVNGLPFSPPQTVVTPSAPGAGANLSYTVPTGPALMIESLTCVFTTDANVANRLMRFRVKRGGSVLGGWAHTASHTASTANTYFFARGMTTSTSSTASVSVAMPALPPLLPGDILETNVASIQVGDAITSIVIWFTQAQTS
jgi:hypothetical protein